MNIANPDSMVLSDDWSDLAAQRGLPQIDTARMQAYRQDRLRAELERAGAAMAVLVSPISLRYAAEVRSYALFQAHIPTSYAFFPVEGPVALHGVYDPTGGSGGRLGRALAPFDGGQDLAEHARLLANDIVRHLAEMGTDNRRVAVEYVNPSLTLALVQRGLEVIDAASLVEEARRIKSPDELACIRWAIAVAEHGATKLVEAVRPGITELQLWGLLNYANLANNGDWHDGRMLASGPRTNPWCQEASPRQIEAGDLVGFDTDMIGPFGYCADVSRTVFCGPGQPTRRQRELYRYAVEEVTWNKGLMRPGMTLSRLQSKAWPVPEEFHEQAYSCVIHGVGMCDEAPRLQPSWRGPNPYDATLESGMVVCVESYIGAVGERDGVKIEEQVLITEDGCEQLSSFPLDERLLD